MYLVYGFAGSDVPRNGVGLREGLSRKGAVVEDRLRADVHFAVLLQRPIRL